MLDRLVAAITDLPVIIQGALGSALFALVLFVGQKLLSKVRLEIAHSNKRRRMQALTDEYSILAVQSAKDLGLRTYFGVGVLFRTMRYLVRGILWLTLGLIFGSTISVFGIIGYIGCVYYLLQALRLVDSANNENAEARLKEIETELASTERTSESTQ